MPNYTFKNLETGELFEATLTLSEREELLKNPNIEQQIVSAPGLVSGVSLKPDAGFRDVLKKIKKNNIRSNIETF